MNYKKIIMAVSMLVMVIAFGVYKPANAQFNRVGNHASVQASYIELDPKGQSTWQGVQITNMIPLGIQSKVMDQPIGFNLDVSGGYVTNNDLNAAFGQYGVGVTTWFNGGFEKSEFSAAPYVRLGLGGSSGNYQDVSNSNWIFQVEPGLIVKAGNFYGLVSYNYMNNFSNGGLQQSALGFGLGVDLTKSFAVEARYDLGYGSYDTNKLNLGLTYRF